MKRRSPRVVAIGRKPLRRTVGDLIYHTVMPASINAMQTKNTATGVVQAIHSNMAISSKSVATEPNACLGKTSDAAHRKTLGDVMPDKPNHDGSGDDGQHARRSQRRPSVATPPASSARYNGPPSSPHSTHRSSSGDRPSTARSFR